MQENDIRTRTKRRSIRVCRSAMSMERRRSTGLFWGLVALILVAGFGVFGARTDSARRLFENRLQRRTGLTAAVSSSRIGWPYDVVLENVTLSEPIVLPDGADGERPVLRLEALRLGWRFHRGSAIVVRGADVTLYTDRAGRTHPPQWAPWTDVEDAGAVAAWVTRWFGDGTRVTIEGASIASRDAGNRTLTAVRNLRLWSAPLRVPDRSWRYFSMTADHVQRADGQTLTGLHQEWLVSAESSLIQLGYTVAGRHPEPEKPR